MTQAFRSIEAMAQEAMNAACRDDFYTFAKWLLPILRPGMSFVDSWYVEAVCTKLWFLIYNPYPEIDNRLIINLPPRHLKSLLCSVLFPLWVLGVDPTRRITVVTYGDELSRELAEDRRRILESETYRRIFPQLKTKRVALDAVRTDRGGAIIATSVGGSLTGRGGDVFILDDLIKAADAQSKAKRDSVNNWLANTLASRPDDKSKVVIVLVMQRLHVEDPTGVLLRTGQYFALILPAIAEFNQDIELMYGRRHIRKGGDLLSPEREPMETLDQLRQSLGAANFSAQYQQNPIPPEGGIIKVKAFNYYHAAPAQKSGDIVIQSWDTALTETQTSDYTVGTTWLVRGYDYYLLERVRARLGFPALKREILAARARYPAAHILVEDCASGISVIQQLRAENVRVIAVKAKGDKVSRAHRITPVVEAGRIFLPRTAGWTAEFVHELAAFPSTASHDDQVDSTVQAINYWEGKKLRPTLVIGSY